MSAKGTFKLLTCTLSAVENPPEEFKIKRVRPVHTDKIVINTLPRRNLEDNLRINVQHLADDCALKIARQPLDIIIQIRSRDDCAFLRRFGELTLDSLDATFPGWDDLGPVLAYSSLEEGMHTFGRDVRV